MIEHLFTCAICEREVHDYRDRNGRDRALSPVCRSCESHYGSRAPQAGAFMDRRKAVQISALAAALCGKAHCMQWEAEHGRA